LDPPPPLALRLFLAVLPALGASIFAAATAVNGALSEARKRALSDVLPKGPADALRRYLAQGRIIETRWTVVRVAGVTSSTLLIYEVLPHRLGVWSIVLAVLGATVAFGFPAEIAKALALQRTDQAAPLLIRVLRPLEWLAAPFAAPVSWVGHLIRFTLPRGPEPESDITDEEVENIVEQGEKAGSIAHDEAEMIKNVLDFGDLTAGEVMVPRTHVAAIEVSTNATEVLRRVVEDEHSRYPVYAERIDNVVGILHVKDLLARVTASADLGTLDIDEIVNRPVLFAAESQSASSVLREMRAKRQHLAIIIDEFGGMSGIVTLEDLLERIVGDIRDEHDEEDPPIVELGEGRLMVDAAVPIVDLSRYLGTDLPEHNDYNSLGGLLVAHFGRVPPVGARLSEYGLDFVVRAADQRHVSQVEIVRSAEPSDSLAPKSLRPTS